MAEPPSITGYEAIQFAEHKDHRHFTEDDQLVENQDLAEHEIYVSTPSPPPSLLPPPLPPSLPPSEHGVDLDSAESILTPPPESDLDDARRKLRRNDVKGSSVPRKKDEDAAAAAELFVDDGGRKPLECSRKDGGKDGAVREQQ